MKKKFLKQACEFAEDLKEFALQVLPIVVIALAATWVVLKVVIWLTLG